MDLLLRLWPATLNSISAAYIPPIEVYCPSSSYELGTIRLSVWRNGLPKNAKPVLLVVETSEQIEVQGDRQRQVRANENWFLIPKEQGEYEIVVRGTEGATVHKYSLPLRVYRVDHIPRRWFVFCEIAGGVIGALGAIKALASRAKASP